MALIEKRRHEGEELLESLLGDLHTRRVVLLRRNRPLVNSVLTLTALAVNVTLNLVLIPRWGIVGTGVGSSIAYVLLAVSYLVWLRRAANLTVRDFRPGLPELLRRG